jgi:hypothetical protein
VPHAVASDGSRPATTKNQIQKGMIKCWIRILESNDQS